MPHLGSISGVDAFSLAYQEGMENRKNHNENGFLLLGNLGGRLVAHFSDHARRVWMLLNPFYSPGRKNNQKSTGGRGTKPRGRGHFAVKLPRPTARPRNAASICRGTRPNVASWRGVHLYSRVPMINHCVDHFCRIIRGRFEVLFYHLVRSNI